MLNSGTKYARILNDSFEEKLKTGAKGSPMKIFSLLSHNHNRLMLKHFLLAFFQR